MGELGATGAKRKTIINIIVLGGSNAGKTSLIRRYACDEFSPERRVTLGVDFETKAAVIMETPVTIQIWDTAGQERHQGLIPAGFFRTADGCLLVYDVTSRESWAQLVKWQKELLDKLPLALKSDLPVIVIGNKIDQQKTEDQDSDEEEKIVQWCRDHEYPLLKASVKDDIGVKVAVEAIAALAVETKATREALLKEDLRLRSSTTSSTVDFGKMNTAPSPRSCC